MGCGSSKLAGDSFNAIDASNAKQSSRKPKIEVPPQVSGRSFDEPASKTPRTMRLNGSIIGATGFKSEDEQKESARLNREAMQRKSQSESHEHATPEFTSEPVDNTKPPPVYTRGPPHTTTSEDRAAPDPVTGRKPSLYQRYQNYKLGPGEPRDPETGKGLYSGLTKEEIIERVPKTTAGGPFGHGGKYNSFDSGGFGGGAGWA